MDKGDSTCIQRCAVPGVSRLVAAQRTRREFIVTTAGLNESISGAILFDKAVYQQPHRAALSVRC
jgi:fructose-bisphosphate aldolase class I